MMPEYVATYKKGGGASGFFNKILIKQVSKDGERCQFFYKHSFSYCFF